jgi:hypothetical protein
MDLNDTARVRQPRDPVEYRLATITDITYSTPNTTHIRQLELRFPTGEHRTYTPAEVWRAPAPTITPPSSPPSPPPAGHCATPAASPTTTTSHSAPTSSIS